ncbi:MAG: hypothetical protein ACR2IK_12805 [Chloroflexota bacterium]
MIIALAWETLRRRSIRLSLAGLLTSVSAGAVEVCAFAWKAARCHPFSLACTALLLGVSASLAGASALLAVLAWALVAVLSLATWWVIEPLGLRRLGCRPPGHLERERLDPALGSASVELLVVDATQPWLGGGVRTLVISRALLDLLEDRALAGLLTQATIQVHEASLPGELVVWLGNAPLLGTWHLSRGLVQLGRMLAVVVGASLVLPLVMWPDRVTRWAGRLLGVLFGCVLGAVLLSSGLPAVGLGVLLAWLVVPGLRVLLNWETRQAETAADDAACEAGRGWELLEALETLTWGESVPPPAAPLGWLSQLASPLTGRADRIWRKLSQP